MKILRVLAITALALSLIMGFSQHKLASRALAQSASMPRVNVPFFDGEIRFSEMAIFWFGRVTPTESYADVRVGYNSEQLYVYVAVFDQRIWYDTTPTPEELAQWDAVTLYLSLSDAFGPNTYRFIAQLNFWGPRDEYQHAYQGSSTGWTEASINFTSQSAWRGNAPNDDTDSDRGWAMNLYIPFASLGLSGPPASGTQWRIAVTVHDRDSEPGPPRPDTHWPPSFSPNNPQTWGQLSFGMPTYTPPSAIPGGTVTIRHGLNSVVVPDAGLGGTTGNLCPGDENYIWNQWGEDNFGDAPDFNVQNQSDIADWPCFSKYYITFPLDAIPPGKVILSATLTIYQFGNSGDPNAPDAPGLSWIQVLTTESDWNEQTISWNNAPLASENIGGAWVPIILPNEWPGWPGIPRNFDVSLAVARAYNAGQPARLILYEADSQYHSGKYFVSSNTGDWNAQGRPTLTVVWGTAGSSSSSNTEWTQHAHDAQHTSYTDQVVPTPWRWKWAWNGPNSSGGISPGKFGLPRNSQPVTGGGRVYIAAGSRGVYALNNADGSVVWNRTLGSDINSTPAYDLDTNALFVVASNGMLYKLDAATGATLGQFSSGSSSPLPLPPAVIFDRVLFSMGTRVYAINKQTMSQIWAYNAGAAVHTPPAYSPSRNRVIVATEDLYVHAIDNATGAQVWRVKPTVRTGGDPGENNSTVAEVKNGWPVIAESHGYVLIKLRLDWQALWDASPWPADNAAMRSYLQQNPQYQALFVLDLDDGSVPFIAHVGHGGFGDGGYLPMGPQPVVKRFANGDEIAYVVMRGEPCILSPCDGRGDSHLGELVLDDTTVPGYLGGYVRFMQNTFFPTDEQAYISMSGDYIFGGHWEAGIAHRIVDRSPSRGTGTNPIVTENLPHIATSQDVDVCGTGFSATHYCEQGLTNTRSWPGGFYIYWQQGNVYDQYWSEYAQWVVSNNTVYFVSTDGAVVALESAQSNQTGALFRIERTTGNVYTDGQFYAGGADIAEHIRVSEPVEPGDVVELDPDQLGYYRKSRHAYSPLAAGVISSAPGVIIGSRGIETLWAPTLALAGVVPVKVTTENGPIRPGDLLTTSSLTGHAMRCAHPTECDGALIGKALGSLAAGTGIVPMLVVR